MATTVAITAQTVVQAIPSRPIVDLTGQQIGTDQGTQYKITGTVNGSGPYTVRIWTEVYTQTQAQGYAGPTWPEIVAAALVLAADPPSQNLGAASLVGQTLQA
jgi:hypothetical protein